MPEQQLSRPIIWRVARVMISSIFVVAGLGHLMRPEEMAQRLVEAPIGAWLAAHVPAEPLMLATGIPLLVGGLALAFGWKQRAAAGGLLLMLVPITLGAHLGRVESVGPLFKNIGLGGALLLLMSQASNLPLVTRPPVSPEPSTRDS